MPDWLGKTIGKVRIDKYLARGGMAEVYLGTHLTLERPVAIKVLHGYIEENPDLLARFHREAKVVAGLRHPNIVQVYDFDAVDGHPYIVMEYLKGPTLSTYLRNLHSRNERIPHHQVARLLKGLTAALDHAHGQGVIHRDIKPGNILLHDKSEDISLDRPLSREVEGILTDFGLVRIVNAASQTASGMVSGTPAYMSPEQARGDQTDYRTDVYSLGIVLYEMLAGRVPFEADSSMSVIYMQINEPPPPIAGISPPLQAVMDRALLKDPADRYQTCREMSVDFFIAMGMTAEAETIIEALPEESLKRATARIKPRPARRLPLWIGAGLLSIVLLFAIVFGAFRLASNTPALSSPTEGQNTEVTEPATVVVPTDTPDLPDGMGMVEIPAGTYEVGNPDANEYHVSPLTILLAGLWMDIYQTTNAQYQQFLAETNSPPPEVWPGEPNHPVRGVTWDQAEAYCSHVKKRLPTEAEWEAAGRGPGASPQLYPWGNDPTAGGNTFNLPDQNTYPVGGQPFNESLFGVSDMVGNIWEWVGDPYNSIPDGYRILRGGRFGIPVLDLAYRLTVAPEDTFYIQYAGFRCAADQVR
jgi:serine/threonine protein kinase